MLHFQMYPLMAQLECYLLLLVLWLDLADMSLWFLQPHKASGTMIHSFYLGIFLMPVPDFKVRTALLHSETHFLNFDLNYW